MRLNSFIAKRIDKVVNLLSKVCSKLPAGEWHRRTCRLPSPITLVFYLVSGYTTSQEEQLKTLQYWPNLPSLCANLDSFRMHQEKLMHRNVHAQNIIEAGSWQQTGCNCDYTMKKTKEEEGNVGERDAEIKHLITAVAEDSCYCLVLYCCTAM